MRCPCGPCRRRERNYRTKIDMSVRRGWEGGGGGTGLGVTSTGGTPSAELTELPPVALTFNMGTRLVMPDLKKVNRNT